MTIWQSILLGVTQGLTEFLPVSSSGHLVLLEEMFSLEFDPLALIAFDVLLHAGTLLALLCVYFWDWIAVLTSSFTGNREKKRLFLFLIIATIPGGAAGLLLDDWIANVVRGKQAVAIGLICTGCILLLGEWLAKKKQKPLTIWTTISMGIAQAFALMPGLSRAGLTISTGRVLGLERKRALDFSFMMAVPIIGGATLVSLRSWLQGEVTLPATEIVLAGFLTSFVVSLLAILFLRKCVSRFGLHWFALYLIPVGAALLIGFF